MIDILLIQSYSHPSFGTHKPHFFPVAAACFVHISSSLSPLLTLSCDAPLGQREVRAVKLTALAAVRGAPQCCFVSILDHHHKVLHFRSWKKAIIVSPPFGFALAPQHNNSFLTVKRSAWRFACNGPLSNWHFLCCKCEREDRKLTLNNIFTMKNNRWKWQNQNKRDLFLQKCLHLAKKKNNSKGKNNRN